MTVIVMAVETRRLTAKGNEEEEDDVVIMFTEGQNERLHEFFHRFR
jgi:hypothetical protein